MNSKSSNVERVTGANSNIFSPFSTPDGDIFFACQSGEILRHKDGQMKVSNHSKILLNKNSRSNLPVVVNHQHSRWTKQVLTINLNPRITKSIGKTCFIADLAHQAIFSKNIEDKTSELSQLVKDFEGEPFLGPHSLALTDDMSIFQYIKIKIYCTSPTVALGARPQSRTPKAAFF